MRAWLGAAMCVAALAPADASVLSDILQRGTLRIGTTGDYPPFTRLETSTGEYSGFDIDLAQSLGPRSACA